MFAVEFISAEEAKKMINAEREKTPRPVYTHGSHITKQIEKALGRWRSPENIKMHMVFDSFCRPHNFMTFECYVDERIKDEELEDEDILAQFEIEIAVRSDTGKRVVCPLKALRFRRESLNTNGLKKSVIVKAQRRWKSIIMRQCSNQVCLMNICMAL